MTSNNLLDNEHDIAVIGYACRVPGAHDADHFWNMLCNGKEALVDIHSHHEAQISKAMMFSGATEFDANFFDYSRFEAELLDPQQRIFLETCWHALEMAGYAPDATPGLFGIYAGCAFPTYLLDNIHVFTEQLSHAQRFQLMITNDKDYLATRVAYKLNLLGQAVNVQTACSTSLVALHQACQALLNGELDGALAGGVSFIFPQNQPYVHQEGMILSEDGHCRPFAADASGTVLGDGAGVVVLKRYSDAVRDNDTIYALIKGTAINNDGHKKVSFIAPNMDSQAAVIREALSVAGVDPKSISYIEAHGTGTKLGDPIEIAALKQVFTHNEKASCALGSVKANIGHLNTASGIIGAIKTIMALQNEQIPPQINCDSLNPACELEDSFLYLNKTMKYWASAGERSACVSSFGFGGTNAHAVFQQAPTSRSAVAPWHQPFALKLSAKTAKSLSDLLHAYQSALIDLEEEKLANFCYTANVGRSEFSHRVFFCAANKTDLIAQVAKSTPLSLAIKDNVQIHYYFGSVNSHWHQLNHQLQQDPLYKKLYEHYAQFFTDILTEVQQVFISQMALAQYLRKMDIHPMSIAGEGIGLVVASVVSGHIELEQALNMLSAEHPDIALKPGKIKLTGYEDLAQLKEALIHANLDMPSKEWFVLSNMSESFTLNHENNHLIALLGFCYRAGITVNWATYYKHYALSRIAIPGYAFDRQEYTLNKKASCEQAQSCDYLYDIQWQTSTLQSKEKTADDDLFLVLVNANDLSFWQQRLIEKNCLFVVNDPNYPIKDSTLYPVDCNKTQWEFLHQIQADNPNKKLFIIHTLAINAKTLANVEQNIIEQSAYQALLTLGQFIAKNTFPATLWLLADSLIPSELTSINPLHSSLSGLAAVMATEMPKQWGGLIHCEYLSSWNSVFSTISQAEEPMHALINDQSIKVPKLVPVAKNSLTPYKPQDGDIYIIVGATGAIGQLVQQQLIQAGAKHLVLISRHATNLKTTQASVILEHIRADVADFSALSLALSPYANNKSIKGIIHAAGVLDDAILVQQTLEHYVNVAQVKVQGSWNLHVLSMQYSWPLDFFVMFSSLSALFGPLGQANYAAANAFQNSLSDYRQQQGLKSTSVLLGGLDNLGMSKTDAVNKHDVFSRINIPKINASFFMDALANIYRLTQAQIVLQPMELETIKTDLLSPLQRQLVSLHTLAPKPTQTNAFRLLLATQSAETQLETTIQFVQKAIAEKINCPIDQVALNTGFNELGLDSLMAVDIKEEVDKYIAINLPITSFFNDSTVVKLSQVIVDLCQIKSTAPPKKLTPALSPNQEVTELSEEDLASLISAEFEQL